MTLLVGLLDSGVGAAVLPRVAAANAFVLDTLGKVITRPAQEDLTGHGSTLAQIILNGAPAPQLVSAQVFTQQRPAAPAVVAAGLDWLVSQRVRVVNMSFGVRHDRPVLRDACERALQAGVVLVAASPARGDPVFPSAYSGVLRVTGDARCGPTDLSHLATAQADFGACPRSVEDSDMRVGGASFAVAHVTAAVAKYLADGGESDSVDEYLKSIACYFGPERKSVASDTAGL